MITDFLLNTNGYILIGGFIVISAAFLAWCCCMGASWDLPVQEPDEDEDDEYATPLPLWVRR